MSAPGLTFANCFANGRKCLTSIFFPLHWHGSLALGPSARIPMINTGSRGLASADKLVASGQKVFFMAGFCVNSV